MDERARTCPDCATWARRSKARGDEAAGLPSVAASAAGVGEATLVLRRIAVRSWIVHRGVAAGPAAETVDVSVAAATGAAVADGGRTVMQSARDHGVSSPVVAAAFTIHAAAVLPAQPGPVEVLGIDETRRGRPKWIFDEVTQAWNTTVDRWHVGFCDLSNGQGCWARSRTQCPGRHRLARRTIRRVADQVTFVAIDMCTIFKSAVRARCRTPS